MSNNYIITIGREYGSGGHEIGEKLAEQLGIKCYDKEIVDMAIKEKGIDPEEIEKADERKGNSILHPGGYFMNGWNGKDIPAFGNFGGSKNDKIFRVESEIIHELAEKESCVIVGRCADSLLRDQENVMRVFVQAPKDVRTERIAKKYDITEERAKKEIDRVDKMRDAYYQYYTDDKWGGRNSKDFVINSAFLGIDGSVDFLKSAVEQRFR
ncbi:cytidylate kinase-like family protein [Frisingicoccus sp.]|uniref:cytidylate kinase-like family protein n=1 Tax=Frisingicoccus sp. TaxID=1918627 RepID=UPI003AB8412C